MFNNLRLKLCSIALIVMILPCMLFGCYDLGDYKNVEEYYTCFNTATLVSQDLTKNDYLVQDCFYNSDTVEKNKCFIEENEYMYFSVKSTRGLNVSAFSLCVCSGEQKKLNVTLFVCDSINEFVGYELIISQYIEAHPEAYGNLQEDMFATVGNKIMSKSITLLPNEWGYIYIDPININIRKNQYLVLKIDNNSNLNCGKEQNIALKFTNLLLKADFD